MSEPSRPRKWAIPLLIGFGSLVLFAIGVVLFCFALQLQNSPESKSFRDGAHPVFRDVPRKRE